MCTINTISTIYPPPCPRSLRKGTKCVSNVPVMVLKSGLLIELRDPPSLGLGSLGLATASWFLMFFWYRLGTSFFRILVPTWPQLASQLGLKILPKSSQEPSKIYPNIDLIIDHFFYWFFIDFSLIFDPKINENSTKNLSTNDPNNTTTKWCRCPKNIKKPIAF